MGGTQRQPSTLQRLSVLAKLSGHVRSLTEQVKAMLMPVMPAGGFNMSACETARNTMIDWLWAGDYNNGRAPL